MIANKFEIGKGLTYKEFVDQSIERYKKGELATDNTNTLFAALGTSVACNMLEFSPDPEKQTFTSLNRKNDNLDEEEVEDLYLNTLFQLSSSIMFRAAYEEMRYTLPLSIAMNIIATAYMVHKHEGDRMTYHNLMKNVFYSGLASQGTLAGEDAIFPELGKGKKEETKEEFKIYSF